jgi:AAA family ATP:ADP antiporter
VFARSAKYSLFDPAKEMVYIEMEKDEKQRGKAAVDLVGSQIGKSGASWITQVRGSGVGLRGSVVDFVSGLLPLVGLLIDWGSQGAARRRAG